MRSAPTPFGPRPVLRRSRGAVHARPDVSDCEVTRSLDDMYGLDEEALKAVSQWQFKPGTMDGQPVPVLVTLELAFTLRQRLTFGCPSQMKPTTASTAGPSCSAEPSN